MHKKQSGVSTEVTNTKPNTKTNIETIYCPKFAWGDFPTLMIFAYLSLVAVTSIVIHAPMPKLGGPTVFVSRVMLPRRSAMYPGKATLATLPLPKRSFSDHEKDSALKMKQNLRNSSIMYRLSYENRSV